MIAYFVAYSIEGCSSASVSVSFQSVILNQRKGSTGSDGVKAVSASVVELTSPQEGENSS